MTYNILEQVDINTPVVCICCTSSKQWVSIDDINKQRTLDYTLLFLAAATRMPSRNENIQHNDVIVAQ